MKDFDLIDQYDTDSEEDLGNRDGCAASAVLSDFANGPLLGFSAGNAALQPKSRIKQFVEPFEREILGVPDDYTVPVIHDFTHDESRTPSLPKTLDLWHVFPVPVEAINDAGENSGSPSQTLSDVILKKLPRPARNDSAADSGSFSQLLSDLIPKELPRPARRDSGADSGSPSQLLSDLIPRKLPGPARNDSAADSGGPPQLLSDLIPRELPIPARRDSGADSGSPSQPLSTLIPKELPGPARDSGEGSGRPPAGAETLSELTRKRQIERLPEGVSMPGRRSSGEDSAPRSSDEKLQNSDKANRKESDDMGDSQSEDNNKASKLIAELLAQQNPRLDNPFSRPEQKNVVDRPAALTDSQIENYSKRLADIISRASDFSYGGKNRQIQEIFATAAAAGEESLQKLVAAANKQLAAKGLALEAKYQQINEEKLISLGNIEVQTHPPRYPDAKFRQSSYACAEFTLKSKSGVEDSLDVRRLISQKMVTRYYSPPRDDR